MRGRLARRLNGLFLSPVLRRIGFHVHRLTSGIERGFFLRLMLGLFAVVAVASVLVTAIEGERDSVGAAAESFGATFYWGVTTVMGAGDASYVTSVAGYLVSWLLVLFGVAIVATITGALVGFVIDFLLKEGQGMGAAGYRDHIVVCGWNSTARELINELSTDEYTPKVVVVHDSDKNPAGSLAYFVSGDCTNADDLRQGRHRRGDGGDHLPRGRQQRRGHALDPHGDGDRDDRSAGAHGGGGEQPGARRALQAGTRRRDRRDLAHRLPAARPVVALPRDRGHRHRHRVRRRGVRALPRLPPGRLRRPVRRRALLAAAERPQRDPPRGRPRRRVVRQPGPRLPAPSPGTTPSSWPSRSARSRR